MANEIIRTNINHHQIDHLNAFVLVCSHDFITKFSEHHPRVKREAVWLLCGARLVI